MSGPSASSSTALAVLTGNPNCGKTTVFNALTGLRAKVGNYAGVTVERKEGRLLQSPPSQQVTILDLPGTYSLSPQSVDEQIARDVLFCRLPEVPAPSVVIVVVDASNLERNLYFATQVIELGYPTLIALNMLDVARDQGEDIDIPALQQRLGVPVIPLVATIGDGLPDLIRALNAALKAARQEPGAIHAIIPLPPALETELQTVTSVLAESQSVAVPHPKAEALTILTDPKVWSTTGDHYSPQTRHAVEEARKRLENVGIDWRSAAIEARYGVISGIHADVVHTDQAVEETWSDRLDRVLTDRLWGILIFVALMALMFQSIFTFARIPMDALQTLVDSAGARVQSILPPGDLNSLLVDGVIAGVGAVVVFLPQILLLFFFIGFLEDTGYMARAAFLMDRLMSKVGLHGKSFIPMLSSFACAIPGIMATRTIESPKDRLVTMLIAPLMSCSARLPVYTLLIAACIPDVRVLGWFKLQGLTMLAMYLLGIVAALFMAWFFKKTMLRGDPPMLIMELPPYKRPVAKVVLRHMWDRSSLFLKRAGTVILGINILLWFLASYPRQSPEEEALEQQRAALTATAPNGPSPALAETSVALKKLDDEIAGARLRHSFAGKLGHWIEPVITPLGFDWKIGIGIVASFAAREVFVSTMSTVYSVGSSEDAEAQNLSMVLQSQTRPDGRPLYSPLTGLTLMVFYVFALQCVSTVAVMRRETNSWKWPLFQWFYMGALAWIAAFLLYQGGRILGFS